MSFGVDLSRERGEGEVVFEEEDPNVLVSNHEDASTSARVPKDTRTCSPRRPVAVTVCSFPFIYPFTSPLPNTLRERCALVAVADVLVFRATT